MSTGNPPPEGSGTSSGITAPGGDGGGKTVKVKKVVRYVEREASPGTSTTSKKSDGLGGAATALVAVGAIAVGLGAAFCVLKFTPFGKRLTGAQSPEKEQ